VIPEEVDEDLEEDEEVRDENERGQDEPDDVPEIAHCSSLLGSGGGKAPVAAQRFA
jgi:hypothetical protein